MSKGGSRLSRLGVLAPAALSACMDASVLAVPAAGAIVSTVLKELSKAFMLKKWFHGVMSAKEAEHLIMEKGKNGSFLVRESQAHPGEYVLSVRVRGRVSHVMIRKLQNKYDVGSGEEFDDLVGLIEHFRSYPMIEASGDVLRLLQPVSGTSLRARRIDKRVQELQESEDDKSDCKQSFDGEFQTLKMLEHRQVFASDVGMKPENSTKNRYRNVIPYDQTRVILHKRPSIDSSDYINASYVNPRSSCDSANSVQSSNESLNSVQSLKLYSQPKKHVPLVTKSLSDDAIREVTNCMRLDKINGNAGIHSVMSEKSYIAAQGCLSNTKDDFWRMIWQEDIRVIAMITNEVEKGKVKCERYWPLAGQEDTHENLRVKAVSERLYEDYLTRELDVTDNSGCCRTVYQYQFTAWPDHGTPDEPKGLLSFMEEVNRKMIQISQSKNAPEHNILCVHCSAGVGRTGTFIVLDMLIDKVKSSGYNCEIDVYATVAGARAQRGGMVQNKAQYRFIYLALQHYIDRSHFRTKRIYTSTA